MKFATIDKIIISLAILSTLFLSLGFSFNAFGQSQNFLDFKEDLNIIQANEGTDHPTPIYEDQFIVCNMWEVCQVIDTDDFMSRHASEKLWYNFDNDLDTFNIKDLTN